MANKRIRQGPRGGLYTLSNTGRKEYLSHKQLGLPKKKQVSRNGRSNVGRYRGLPFHVFCGPAGGAAKGSFPVNSQRRCRAALSYARFAPRPCGISRCAMAKARQHGWKCGKSSSLVKKCMGRRVRGG